MNSAGQVCLGQRVHFLFFPFFFNSLIQNSVMTALVTTQVVVRERCNNNCSVHHDCCNFVLVQFAVQLNIIYG